MNLIDKENRVRVFLELRQYRFQALLEIAPVLGASQQCAQIQRVDGGIQQRCRYLLFHDHAGQPFGDGRFADTGLADQQRVVLAATAENLRCPLNLESPTHQRINAISAGQFIQVAGVVFQGTGWRALTAVLHVLFRLHGRLRVLHLGDAVSNEIHHIQAMDILTVEEIHCLAFLLIEDGHHHIGAGHFFLAGRLHAEHRTLQHPLEAQGWLGIAVRVAFRQ